jgi:hypothetical protein
MNASRIGNVKYFMIISPVNQNTFCIDVIPKQETYHFRHAHEETYGRTAVCA